MKFQAGSGGDGVCSFHSEPRKEWGGPDGGNGGNGGDIIIKGSATEGYVNEFLFKMYISEYHSRLLDSLEKKTVYINVIDFRLNSNYYI